MIRLAAPALSLLILAAPAPAEERVGTGEGGIGFKLTDARRNETSVDTDGLTVATPDEAVKFRIGGRLQADFGTAGLRGTRLARPFDDNLDFRRTWLETFLTLADEVELVFQYDFASRTPIQDAAVAYRGVPGLVVSLGNLKEPFSLDQLTSDNNTLFAERSLADAIAPARNFGALAGYADRENGWTLSAGVFGGNANGGIDRDGIAGTARLTWAPILGAGEVLHLGIAGGVRALDGARGPFGLAVRPESALFRTSLVETGDIEGARRVARAGLEAAYQTGPLRLQGEYMRIAAGRAGLPDATFGGGYLEAGWTVNGQGRPYGLAPDYGSTFAIFGAPKLEDAQRLTRGGPGLFELAARVSALDLRDRDVRGGREFNYAVGLNWYPDLNVKIMLNYVRAHAAASPAAPGPAGTLRTVDADIFVGRFQLAW